MEPIFLSEQIRIYSINDYCLVITNAANITVALVNKKAKDLVFQHGVQPQAEALFIEQIYNQLKDTPWDCREYHIRYADIELWPALTRYSSENQVP